MIDIDRLSASTGSVNVPASNSIFTELGRNTYDYKDLLSELIDNSLAARIRGQLLNVVISIFVDEDNKPVNFSITDDASGISMDKLGLAVAPAGLQSQNSLNEHGMGMKQAVGAIGKLRYLATKTKDEARARLIKELRFGDVEIYEADLPFVSGTEISISNLNAIVSSNPSNYTRSIVPYLGARYRRFLKPDAKEMDLKIKIINGNGSVQYEWAVKEEKPIYFHPSTRNNEPVILKHKISGDGWEAELTFGYAPTKNEEYEELGVDEPTKFHPYKVSLTNQGLDIIFHNRVILFHQLSELGIVPTRHNDYNNVRGEIDLKVGFSTAITKNSMIYDAHFVHCIDEIKKILNGEAPGPKNRVSKYLEQKTYPEELPEALLQERLAEWLANNPVNKKNTVNKEFVVQGIEGYIDILADGEAWELKTGQANAQDVYQLFMYMDVGSLDKGYLIAKSFTTGAQVAKDHIAARHKKEVILAPLSQFPINHPPTEQERQDYY